MKKSLLFFVLSFFALFFLNARLMAQVPQLFNYQGIARDAGGNVLPNRMIGVELSVLDGGPTGTVVYQETFTDTTNAFGLFSMQVGGGTVVSGSFAAINWATGNKYLQTAIDLTGGTNYTLSGTTQLLSVPYALYAQRAVVPVGGAWKIDGNTSIADSNFIGTTNNAPLIFKTNGSLSGIIDPDSLNTYLGYGTSGQNELITPVPGGSSNTGIGAEALYANINGSYNTAIGSYSLEDNIIGSYNVAIGGANFPMLTLGHNNSGNYNTAIGVGADVSVDGINNATALGAGAIVTASNMVQIGSSSVTMIQGQVPFTTPSDGRFKFNIREDVKGLDFILKLRPVTYQFNTKKEDDFIRGVVTEAQPVAYTEAMMVRRTGFIAQEVEKAAQQSGFDFDGLKTPKTDREYYSLSYASFVVPLVKAVQEQEGVIERQEKSIDDLTKEVEELRQLILAATKK
jgi:Chaperone of endosialidase